MDKITGIIKVVEVSLDICYKIEIDEIRIIPTQKFDEKTNEWLPDSYAVFLTIRRPKDSKLNEENYSVTVLTDLTTRITDFLEGLLGFEFCVDVV